jgi:F5/8 type C domain/Bacterial alpha-L-rhamnosidase C-terminal domain
LLLSQTIAGVAPVEPGWTKFQVLPQEAFLNQMHVVVPTIRGNVTVDLRKTASEYELRVEAPKGTGAIVGVPKRPFERLDAIQIGDVTVWDGAWKGGVEGVTWVGDDAGYVKLEVGAGAWRIRGRGVVRLTSPKAVVERPVRGPRLDSRDWTAKASVPDGTFAFSGEKIPISTAVANAIDGDPWTGWRDMTALQRPGQWLEVDMQRVQRLDTVVLDNTWALFDSPASYIVRCSDDGKEWRQVAEGKGSLGITTITFPAQSARHLRIEQTGTDAKYHWSVYELDVFAPR